MVKGSEPPYIDKHVGNYYEVKTTNIIQVSKCASYTEMSTVKLIRSTADRREMSYILFFV